jgi:protein-tyrosine-phosphatase/DNA-binding transcriptional ArsR family regulator
LAADPVRWRLLGELARSDRRVRELCELVEQPQSLVSYHLGRLRSAGMVARRRSSADGRDTYYRLELERCGELLEASGRALHPGLRLSPPAPPITPARRLRVLFTCTGNSARSQIAEALAEPLGAGRIEAFSAGSHPKPVHANAVRVMREYGLDIATRRAKPLSEFAGRRLNCVVTLCDRVREVCPEFPGAPVLVHWSTPDPALAGGSDAETYPAFRRTAAELAARLPFLIALIDAP